jgi:isopenicillin-N epimerase
MCFSITYGSTKKILNDLCIRSGATLKIVDIPLPISSKDDIIKRVSNEMTSNTKLVIIDQITSNTALNLPIKELSVISKNAGATVIIDAAHALFAHDVSIYSKNNNDDDDDVSISDYCDYWITNGHKWLCTPKGCAFMWISPRMSSHTRPMIISHGFMANGVSPYTDNKKLLSSFAWDGCRDYNALLTSSSALRLWNSVPCGIVGIRFYINNLLNDAINLLIREWKLKEEDFPGSRELRVNSTMCLVPLPDTVKGINTTKDTTDKEAFQLQELLHHEYNIEVPIKCLHGRLYIRISAHIYNTIDDYARLANVIAELR